MKMLLATVAILATISVSYARDFSECDAPPYGVKKYNFNGLVKDWKEDGHDTDLSQTLKKICDAQAYPNPMRDALRKMGFTEKEILEDDPADLFLKIIKSIPER